jgi:hypothetical protein
MSSLGDIFKEFSLATLTGGMSDAYYGYKKMKDGGNYFDFIDRAIDPGGTVDKGTRRFGEVLPQEVRNIAPAVGGLVGNIWGPGGAAAGAGVGSKLHGDDTQTGMRNAGIAALASYAYGQGKDYFSSPSPSSPSSSPELNTPPAKETTWLDYLDMMPSGSSNQQDQATPPPANLGRIQLPQDINLEDIYANALALDNRRKANILKSLYPTGRR